MCISKKRKNKFKIHMKFFKIRVFAPSSRSPNPQRSSQGWNRRLSRPYQAFLSILPFCFILFMYIYWKSETRPSCESDSCSPSDLLHHQKSIRESQRSTLLIATALLLLFLWSTRLNNWFNVLRGWGEPINIYVNLFWINNYVNNCNFSFVLFIVLDDHQLQPTGAHLYQSFNRTLMKSALSICTLI